MKKPVLLGLGGLLAVTAIGAAVFVFVLGPSDGAAAEGESTPSPAIRVEGRLGPRVVLESRVFNLLATPGETQAYVKLETVIEFETADAAWGDVMLGCPSSPHECEATEEALLEEFAQHIGSGITLIEDAITTIVSSKPLREVSTPEGKAALREEIRAAVATLIPHPAVHRVLFTDFVTQ
jgi:flagellar basal body-associated protein FliL